MDPRRPRQDRPPRPALRPLLQPGAAVQRRAWPTTSCRPTATPWRSCINSLSWHPRISIPKADRPGRPGAAHRPARLSVDANLWNRLLAEYPYGVLHDTGVGPAPCWSARRRACRSSAPTGSSPPPRGRRSTTTCCRCPRNLAELERQLRVDVGAEHPAGARRPGRLQRLGHLAQQPHPGTARRHARRVLADLRLRRGAAEPDRARTSCCRTGATSSPTRSGPGLGENGFQHAGGEAIFNLPNGLHAYILVNADNHAHRQGADRHRQRPQAARPRRRGRACRACDATSPRHPPQGRPDPRPRRQEPKAFSRDRRRAGRGAVPAGEEDAGADGRGRRALPQGASRRPATRSTPPRWSWR